MTDTLSIDTVQALLRTIVTGIHVPGAVEDVVYSFDEIEARTGFSARTLLDECRHGMWEWTKKGHTTGMTPSQLAKVITHSRQSLRQVSESGTASEDELAEARRLTAQGAARRRPRGAAA